LNQQANQVARYLLTQGVGPDTPVGLLVERSPEMIVALLAILKSGGCYVPLDPKSPPERLRAIMDDALNTDGVRPIVLTQERLRENIPEHAGKNVALDSDAALWESQPVTNPDGQAKPGHLAYIIYTSGSTGIPKGVMIEHRSIVNYTRHAIKEYEMTAKDKVLQFSSITFDAAGEEIYPVLSAGGTLVLRDEETIRSPQTFIEKCNQHKISLLSMPTTYFHQLTGAVETAPVRFGEHVRAILFGGERVFPQEIQRWQQVYPSKPTLINTYGPTEATVVATTYILPADAAGDSTEIPIGKPVANAQIYVLNHDRQPVGVGIPGELCIGGAGLARGYLNRPELTAERFVDNPMRRPGHGEKIYRTGDLVRLKPDGLLEFIGRADDQVKVRGYRIEPGEIESVLKDHPAIGECAVLARKGDHGDHQLEAYLVLKEPAPQEPVDVRAFLKDRLPEYMIPAHISRLDSFPVTAQGKINRAILPELQRENVGPQTQYVGPTNVIEEQLQEFWQDILKVERVSITDDFFDLGGHSLLATQIISRIQQSFQVELSLRTMFTEPTVKALAAVIATEKELGPVVPAISRIARDKHRITVNAQGDLLGVKK
ncbi:MAG: non-ribosomal peptide synthetase, partial [Candidatus Omnitrophica bacterium]|nr:non-ribosomal peptide synthetase [Candidatus Omnitrophota bacterium]